MDEPWGPRRSGGLRQRQVGGAGGGAGGSPQGPLEPPTRQNTSDDFEGPQDGEPPPPKLRGPSRLVFLSCYTATLSLLFLACAIGGKSEL